MPRPGRTTGMAAAVAIRRRLARQAQRAGQAPAGPVVARIGPNAIHQLVDVLDRREGREVRDRLCAAAGIVPPPADAGMWPEAEAAALHRTVREAVPDRAGALLDEAGAATGDYILSHRIPRLAQWALRALPRGIAARLLARAIAAHAWTFAGSGRFRIVPAGEAALGRGSAPLPGVEGTAVGGLPGGPGARPPDPSPTAGAGARPTPVLVFEIEGNPMVAGERAGRPLCVWHAAVFRRLFGRLVWPDAELQETACAARGEPCCRFELYPRGMGSQDPQKA